MRSRRYSRRWQSRAAWLERARRLSPTWLEWALAGRRVVTLEDGCKAFVGEWTIEVYGPESDCETPDEVLAIPPGPVMIGAAEALQTRTRGTT